MVNQYIDAFDVEQKRFGIAVWPLLSVVVTMLPMLPSVCFVMFVCIARAFCVSAMWAPVLLKTSILSILYVAIMKMENEPKDNAHIVCVFHVIAINNQLIDFILILRISNDFWIVQIF